MNGLIFVSYSGRDARQASELVSVLRGWRFPVFFDRDGIRMRHSAGQVIAHALEQTAATVVLVTDHTNDTPWVREEVQFAARRRVPIVAWRHAGAQLPPWLFPTRSAYADTPGSLELLHQWLWLFARDGAWKRARPAACQNPSSR